MITFRTSNGSILELPPNTIILTGWDQATARTMVLGEMGMYHPPNGDPAIRVLRVQVPTRWENQ